MLPLRIVAKSPDKPVTLRASISYAVCEKLCIPVEAQAELALSASPAPRTVQFPRHSTPCRSQPKSATRPISIHEVRREGNVVQVEIAVQDDKPPAGKERTSSFLSKVQRRTGRYPYRSWSSVRQAFSVLPSNLTGCLRRKRRRRDA
jgi:DsbC/DsbD-like thiol-disulfide interchange protein